MGDIWGLSESMTSGLQAGSDLAESMQKRDIKEYEFAKEKSQDASLQAYEDKAAELSKVAADPVEARVGDTLEVRRLKQEIADELAQTESAKKLLDSSKNLDPAIRNTKEDNIRLQRQKLQEKQLKLAEKEHKTMAGEFAVWSNVKDATDYKNARTFQLNRIASLAKTEKPKPEGMSDEEYNANLMKFAEATVSKTLPSEYSKPLVDKMVGELTTIDQYMKLQNKEQSKIIATERIAAQKEISKARHQEANARLSVYMTNAQQQVSAEDRRMLEDLTQTEKARLEAAKKTYDTLIKSPPAVVATGTKLLGGSYVTDEDKASYDVAMKEYNENLRQIQSEMEDASKGLADNVRRQKILAERKGAPVERPPKAVSPKVIEPKPWTQGQPVPDGFKVQANKDKTKFRLVPK